MQVKDAKPEETFVIGRGIRVTVLDAGDGEVRFAIETPVGVSVKYECVLGGKVMVEDED